MQRFIVFDRQLQPLFDLDGRITEAMRYERINGEHKLDVKTTQLLEEGLRILVRDGTLRWREWVVDEPDERKQDYDIVEGSYGCTWSVQYDLSTVSGGELWPGTYTPITAGAALAMVLATQSRWEVGRVTVTGTAGTSLFDGSVWDYLGKLQEVWGGEIEPRIEVDSNGVAHRYVDWLAHVGSTEATRRFDYGEDCTGIDRKPPVGPMFCRIVPRGGRDATDEDGISYSERVGVEEEPYSSGDGWVHDAGSIWIRDPDAEQNFRTPNPDGTWHYPELVVTYDTDDPEELVWLASADIHKYTRPSPTYEADVLQFAAAGMDAHGVELGDVVHIVDRKFGDAPLRIDARIVEMTVNELDESDVRLVIGEATQGIEAAFKSMRSAIDAAEERARRIEGGGTIVYLQHLLDEINAEINGTGGYSYLVPGEGIVTYDRRVADPLIGTEATQVTQVKGGNIRIADTKKPNFSGINDWNWKTVIVSGHVAAELVTAAHITAGYIGSSNDAVFLDFDHHVFEIGNATTIGDTTVGDLLQDVASAGIDAIEYGTSASSATEPTTWSTTAPTSVAKGEWLWVKTTYKDGTSATTKAYAGEDGTSVSILGSYNTLAELEAAHPTGSIGDGYIVAGDLYVWDGSSWLDVGRIQGPAGQDGTSVTIASREVRYAKSASGTTAPSSGWQADPPATSAGEYIWSRTVVNYSDGTNTTTYNVAGHGADGTSVTVTAIEYGTSADAATQPSTWSTTAPAAIAKGTWLWVRTTYSDGSTATTKSYTGTDGEDGASVYVASSTKTGDTTTVVLSDGTTLTIVDGEDGTNGTNGLNGYVHTAWANSADGSADFSTTVSANKLYLGVYTDNAQADSQSPSAYSWSLIKGANGAKGDKGDKGETGDAARAYSIVVSPDALKREGGTIAPSEITVSATVAVGTSTPQIYMGRFRVEEFDGTTWATTYTSAANESSKTYQPTSAARMIRCTLFAAGGTTTRLDSQTVPVLSDGTDGADGTDGTNGQDAYSVWLTNDSHVFPASGSAAIEGSVSTYVKAYRGSTLLRPVTIGTLPTPPTGMTMTRLNNGSSTADAGLRISVTTALTTRSGTIDIPITVDGKSFTVTLSWALALEGVGIKSVVPQYYLSTSSSSATGGSWSSTPPTWSADHYIWTRNFITWDSNPVRTSTTDEVYDAALTQANREAVDAAKVATDYITDGSSGTDFGKTGVRSKVRITDNGMEVFDGNDESALLAGLQNGTSVVRVGLSDETRAEIDYHSMKLVDKEGNAFFYVSDLRDSSGICTIVEQHVLEDHDPNVWDRATISLVLNAVNTNYTVTRNGVAITSGIYKYTTYFSVLNSANPRNGDKFVVTYQTDSVYAKAFTMGVRLANSQIGVMSMAEGRNCVASEAYSHAEGMSSSATAYSAHAEGGIISNGSLTKTSTASAVAAHAEGGSTASGVASHSEGYNTTASGLAAHSQGRSATASGRSSHAGGEGCTASGDYSHAEGHSTNASGEASATFGTGTKASRTDQFVCGRYNYDRRYGLFAVGYGTPNGTNSNIFDCSYNENDMGSAAIRMFGNVAGTVYVNGQSVHSSDKRLKDHVAYLEDDASDFIRALKPIRYRWKRGGGEHYGFYAQDVRAADPHETETVTEGEQDKSLDFDPLTLDYNALIAPLVAYAQQLEKRIDQQQQAIEAITKRLDALEGR